MGKIKIHEIAKKLSLTSKEVRERATNLGIEVKSAELQRIPNNTKEVNEEQFKINMKMLERFEEDDDVQNVYHNVNLPEEDEEE